MWLKKLSGIILAIVVTIGLPFAANVPFYADEEVPVFQDVHPEDWFYNDVVSAYQYQNQSGSRLMSGYEGNKKFGPVDPLTREQFAVMLYRFEDEPEQQTDVLPFPDVKADAFYTDAVVWAQKEKIIKGYDEGFFGVGDKITREQLATILYRYAEKQDGAEQLKATSEDGNMEQFLDAEKVSDFAKDAVKWANGAGIITGKDEGTRIDPQGNAARAECAAMFIRFIHYEQNDYSYNGYDFLNDASKANISDETVDVIADMQNTEGLLISYYNANILEKIAETLFADDVEMTLEYQDDIYQASGLEEAKEKLAAIETLRANSDVIDLHLNHSPNFVVNNTGDGGRTSYDTYSYFINKTDRTAETCITHIDSEYAYVDGKMKITKVNWQYMESFAPVTYGEAEPAIDFVYDSVDTSMAAPAANAKDFTQIQRILSYFYTGKLGGLENSFADTADVKLDLANLFDEPSIGKENIVKILKDIQNLEAVNENKFICLYYQMDPVININEDGKSAEAWLWSQTFEFKGKAYGNNEALIPIVRNICQIHSAFVKEDGEWKISSFEVNPLVKLPDIQYKTVGGPLGGDRLSIGPSPWDNMVESMGTDNSKFVSDQFILENMMSGWVSTLKRGELIDYYKMCMEPDPDFHMSFKTSGFDGPDFYGDVAKNHIQKLSDSITGAETVPSYHTVTTPYIEFNEDGTYAKAVWAEHTMTNIGLVNKVKEGRETADDPSGEDELAYFIACGKYYLEFRKIDGQWFVEHWYFEPVVSLTLWNTGYHYSRGFTGDNRFALYTKPFELVE